MQRQTLVQQCAYGGWPGPSVAYAPHVHETAQEMMQVAAAVVWG